MNEQRNQWTKTGAAKRSDEVDTWTEPTGLVHGVVLLPHGPMPVCDSWRLELPGSVQTRPHAHASCENLGEVSIPMS